MPACLQIYDSTNTCNPDALRDFLNVPLARLRGPFVSIVSLNRIGDYFNLNELTAKIAKRRKACFHHSGSRPISELSLRLSLKRFRPGISGQAMIQSL